MASTYTPLGVEKMATGENAGTWGTKTNTNLEIIEQISGGYITQAIAGSGTTAFTEDDGSTDALVATRVIVFTGALSGSRVITFPVGVENFYLIKNGTTGDETLQLKAASGSGSTVTWASGDRDWKLVYFDGVATNTGVVDLGLTTAANTQTLTNKTLTTPVITSISNSGTVTIPTGADTLVNLASAQTLTTKTLTSPKIGTSILDTGGNELFLLTATGSAVNQLTYANAAADNDPTFTASGGSTNIGINLVPKGSGQVQAAGNTISTVGKAIAMSLVFG